MCIYILYLVNFHFLFLEVPIQEILEETEISSERR
jgi:hypothetical protein